jgi:lysophospholipase L1-like esterase
MLRTALWGLLFSCGASAWAATGDGGLADPNITYVGRWDKSSSTQYTSHWDGAYLSTKFTGRSVSVKLASKMSFKAIIDGTISSYDDWAQNFTTNGTVNLTPTALANDGPHTLQIVANYDTLKVPFQGLVLAAGATTLPIEPRPLIEFIGDSITAGQGSSQWAITDYAWLTAERLGAHHTQIAWAGITLVDGYHYDHLWPGMESMYFRAWAVNDCYNVECTPVPDHPTPNPAWDFTQYSPKIIVINLGTNDGNLKVPSDTFQSKYTAFLQNVRAQHRDAEIFVMRTFNKFMVPETQNAVAARIAAGDTHLHYVDTDGWLIPYTWTPPLSPDFADGFHPNDTGYQKVSERLASVLQPYLSTSVSVNDPQFRYDSAASWPYGSQSGAYQGDNHWSNATNASYEVPFSGTQVKLYGGRAPQHGIAAVSVDGGAETNVDTYSATRADGVLLWSSPALAAGTHTLKVRVTGMKNVSATGAYVTADRVDIVNGGLNLLKNPGFESGLTGWGTWPVSAPQAYTDVWGPHAGARDLVHWSNSPYQVATYQTLTGLANGLYTARAWMKGSGGQQLYVKNFGSSQMVASLPASDGYSQLVIPNINVTNGYAEVGLWTDDGTGGKWMLADDVSFYKQ